LALGAAAYGAPAQAADWPERPVTLIVPFAPGGNTDMMARIVADRLTQSTGKPFIVDNKAGAGGTIAADYVAKTKKDGYTLFFGTLTQIATAPYTNKISYDPLKDFVPIANVGGNPYVIAARPNAPFKTLPELVKYGRENPGKLTVGHAGVGGLTHLSAALFLSRAGISAVMVPYKGGAPALVDVMSGQTVFYSGNLSEVLPYARSDKLRLIAVSSSSRIPQLPEVPTIAETYPGHVVETWNGILGPTGMPDAGVEFIASEMTRLHANPEFQAKLVAIGVTPIPEIKDAFKQRILADVNTWKPVIQVAGIVPE
jgi:tripartite-type tricarboxylate transporter receptor subunit TctC